MPEAYDPTSAIGMVRLLLNDVDPVQRVFTDPEIQAFLDLEGDSVKLAAATAIDVNATDQVLAAKVLRTDTGVSTDGAKVADAMRKHADRLRQQADADDEGWFEIVDGSASVAELAAWPY